MTHLVTLILLTTMTITASATARAADQEYDILVVGGTASGSAAAVTAARMGSRVALIEETQRLGGMAANGLGATDLRNPLHSHGLFDEFRRRVAAHYGAGNGLKYEPKVADAIFKEMAAEQPCLSIFYCTRAVGVKMQGDRIGAVAVQDLATGKRRRIRAKLVIDAAIEGDVAAWAGAEWRVGREARSAEEPHAGVIYYDNDADEILPAGAGKADRKVQSYAYLLVAKDYGPDADKTIPKPENYDPENYRYSPEWEKSWPFGSGRLPNAKYELNQHPWGIDLPGINYDYPTANFKRREEIARRYREHALGYLYFLQTERGHKNLGLPDDEFQENGGVPPTLYVREARRVMGRALLTESDVTRARERIQPTSIGIGDYPMDSHAIEAPPPPSPELRHRGEGEYWLVRQTPWYPVPLGVIIPTRVENLLVSSAVSATHVGYGTLRMEPTRMTMGQAAGTLANLALAYNRRPDQVDLDLLQDKLIDQGVYLTWFSDINTESRHFKAIQFLGARGLFPGEKFRPAEPLTRGEAASQLLALRKLLAPNATQPLPISAAHPDAPLTRREMAHWLVQTMESIRPGWSANTAGEPRYGDISPNDEAYADAQALANHRIDARNWRIPEERPNSETSFHPQSEIARDDFAMALFLAYRGVR